MSMNAHLGTRTCEAPLFQTPTKVTYRIIESPDPLQAYLEWLQEWLEPDEYIMAKGRILAYVKAHPDAKWTMG